MSEYVQYTIRNVPPSVDAKLKAQAKKRGVSLNKLLLDKIGALPKPSDDKPKEQYDLDFLIGSMTVQETDEFDRTLRQAREADRRQAKKDSRRPQQ